MNINTDKIIEHIDELWDKKEWKSILEDWCDADLDYFNDNTDKFADLSKFMAWTIHCIFQITEHLVEMEANVETNIAQIKEKLKELESSIEYVGYDMLDIKNALVTDIADIEQRLDGLDCQVADVEETLEDMGY